MNDSIENDFEHVRARCGLLADQAAEQARYHQEQGSVLLRWSVTTCMTINAGALVATLNVDGFDRSSQIWAGGWFLGGTAISVVMGGILASTFLKMGQAYSQSSYRLRQIHELGDKSQIEKLDAASMTKHGVMGGFAVLSLILTLIAFVVGCAILIEGAR